MIEALLEQNKIQEAYDSFISLHPHDKAKVYLTLSKEHQKLLNEKISNDELSEMLTYIEPEVAADILESLSLTEQKDLIEQMPIDDAVDVIDELTDANLIELLKVIEDPSKYKSLLEYKANEAGSLMTSKYIKLTLGMDVKDAMRLLIEDAPKVESLNTLFVTDSLGNYVGTLPLNRLIKAKSPLLIDELIEESPAINDLSEIDITVHTMREYALYQIAVINDFDKLIGTISLDDAIEAYEKVTSEDFMQFAALGQMEDKSIVKSAMNRFPWLIILLLASIPLALVGTGFEEVLMSFAILALFQPLILDASGDVATQTLAVTLRRLNHADGISVKNGLNEIATGSINAVFLGIASALITYFMAIGMNIVNPVGTALVVGLSLLITVVAGPIIGFLVPVILSKLKIDPAVASGPFITTLVDLLSILVFFGLASVILM